MSVSIMVANQRKQSIKVGTRGSRLALVQVDEIRGLLQDKGVGTIFERKVYDTKGDIDRKTPLADPTLPDDFFTDTLDRALLNKEIDVAIHSAKDLPQQIHPDLKIFALTTSFDDTDAFVGKTKFNELPSGAKVGTSSALRKQSVKELRSDLTVVDIRDNIEERLRLVDEGYCDGIIVATAALKRLGVGHLIQDTMPWEATALQGQLAVVGRAHDTPWESLFSCIDVRKSYGEVLLVGAGPGDPDLITLKGIKALRKADCVFYDYLVHQDILEHAPKSQKIYVGKRKGEHTLPQSELSKQLRDKAREGKTVVRLKGGDPLIFGRGADEIEYLRSYHIAVEIIPGVSSATAIPSTLGIPLTARHVSSSVAFLSGYSEGEKTTEPKPIDIPTVDTIVFLMGLTKLDMIIKSLNDAGWRKETPIIVISKGTRLDEKIVSGRLMDIKQKVEEQNLEPPVLIVVGEVVQFWRQKPLTREKFLYTGTNPERYRSLGQVVHFPMIKISEAHLGTTAIEKLVSSLDEYHIILFTSRFGVKYFFEFLQEQGYPLADLKIKDFIVIGKATAQALQEYDFEPVIISTVETGQGLLDAIREKYDVRSKKVLFPRSNWPNPFLEKGLTKLGAKIELLPVYENTKPDYRELPKKGISNIIFTSPSTVINFLKDYDRIPDNWRIFSRGPLTTQALKEAGYQAEVLIHE